MQREYAHRSATHAVAFEEEFRQAAIRPQCEPGAIPWKKFSGAISYSPLQRGFPATSANHLPKSPPSQKRVLSVHFNRRGGPACVNPHTIAPQEVVAGGR